ncbi:PREDICTED: uncharacterized protein LOC109216346 [Nicotiana attenuata]|uniref:uncharacterized protein LOC109216346 n=1 Tax=Nicotiana attenuata TaxID=49451 RepID=UPI00090546D3|nr:PREDICTED: uncharacterized protein LOC109216346 [Nicotiana attenuata]
MEQNQGLLRKPNKDEAKMVVFGLNSESAGGPDGFTGCFFHSCCDIIDDDISDMVKAFFNVQELPKCLTHTNLVLLPKKKVVTTFSHMRPISLSNIINKVFSRVINERMRTEAGPNVVIKLDMTKDYDRLSWLLLTKVLRKMGFSERFIGLVYGIVSNNWYSLLLNGPPHSFFKSSKGVKQGDPLSPTLSILAVEVLPRGFNALHMNLYFCGCGMPNWSPKINHLAYAYDIIIVSSSDATSWKFYMRMRRLLGN